jgi:flavorubredoxin
MADTFKATKISDNVYWVGAIDWDVRNFHGYLTQRGTTYNAFLIMGEKITLIDTVKAPFFKEMMARIASVVDPSKVEVLVSNHAELDHSGSIPRTIEAIKPSEIYASKPGVKALEAHFHMGADIKGVGDGDTLSLGNLTLAFAETRMCHWPDSMVSYLVEDQILFSQDGFGMHLATTERFGDEVDMGIMEYEAAKYYANILLPLGTFVNKTLEKWTSLGLPLKVLAPDHGPIFRTEENINWIIGRYAEWASQPTSDKAVIVYETMWESTRLMARAIHEGMSHEGVTTRLLPLRGCHRSDVVTEMMGAGALVVGTPTINQGMYPAIADILTYIKGLKPANKVAAAFGSFGWSGEGAKDVHAMLADMGLDMATDEPLRLKYVPDAEAFEQCRQYGIAIAKALKAKLAN